MRPRPRPRPTDLPASVTPADATALSGQLADQRARNTAIRDRAAQSVHAAIVSGTSIDTATPLAIVPRQVRPLVPLPSALRETFLTRLAHRLQATFADSLSELQNVQNDESDSSRVANVMESGCTLCRGTCCTRGGDHAFLGQDSLTRVRRATPALNEADLRATYAAHLPQEHVEHSCVFHGDQGCTLPHGFRSNTCNRYLCGGLTQLARTLLGSGGSTAVIGVSDNHSLLDLALVQRSTITPIAIVGQTAASVG